MKLKVKKLHFSAKLPKQATEGSAGYDLYSCFGGTVRNCSLIDTGISMQIPRGYVGVIKSRSSMAVKGIHARAGVIDSDYTGEIKVLLSNSNDNFYQINPGDKIAQMLIVPCAHFEVEEVESLEDTERGSGGFGSTGQ